MVAELYGLWRALSFCIEISLNEVEFEGDALDLVREVNSTEMNFSFYVQVIEDIKTILMDRPTWRVLHISRERNKVAHQVAKQALELESETV